MSPPAPQVKKKKKTPLGTRKPYHTRGGTLTGPHPKGLGSGWKLWSTAGVRVPRKSMYLNLVQKNIPLEGGGGCSQRKTLVVLVLIRRVQVVSKVSCSDRLQQKVFGREAIPSVNTLRTCANTRSPSQEDTTLSHTRLLIVSSLGSVSFPGYAFQFFCPGILYKSPLFQHFHYRHLRDSFSGEQRVTDHFESFTAKHKSLFPMTFSREFGRQVS